MLISHVSPSGSQKNVYKYLMYDVNESSSESDIFGLGIVDFANSPHKMKKKKLTK